jgi:hypothetical protein
MLLQSRQKAPGKLELALYQAQHRSATVSPTSSRLYKRSSSAVPLSDGDDSDVPRSNGKSDGEDEGVQYGEPSP